jgi:hypothetical protein
MRRVGVWRVKVKEAMTNRDRLEMTRCIFNSSESQELASLAVRLEQENFLVLTPNTGPTNLFSIGPFGSL